VLKRRLPLPAIYEVLFVTENFTVALVQERSSSSEGSSDPLASLTVPTTGMAKGLGSSGGSATLQRSKLSNKQELRQTSPKLDDGMGGGGLGKGIFNGGGGDGDDGGDDDDYFGEGGEFRPQGSPLPVDCSIAITALFFYLGLGHPTKR
jgi:hypothetical protein